MTANEAKIRECYKKGLTTLNAIRPHVSCVDHTIKVNLMKISKELTESNDLQNMSTLRHELNSEISSHRDMMIRRLSEITQELEAIDSSDKRFVSLLREERATLSEIRKLSGSETLLKVAEKQALKSVDQDQENEQRSTSANSDSFFRIKNS